MDLKKKNIMFVLGSKNDIPYLKDVKIFLNKKHITYSVKIASTHRGLKKLTTDFNPKKLQDSQTGIIIAVAHSVANMPAILAGYLKNTTIPVIGVGLEKTQLDAIEALLSVMSIPKGVPFVHAGLGKIGLYNATLAAIKILRLN